jgi:hypothetical protein
MRRFLDLCRFETKQGTLNEGAGILDGWFAFIMVWAAVIAILLAIVAALLGRTLLDAQHRQRIVALACGPPPEGRSRWTVRLLTEEVVKRKLEPRVGRETIRVLLESHDLKPWREKNVVRGGTG